MSSINQGAMSFTFINQARSEFQLYYEQSLHPNTKVEQTSLRCIQATVVDKRNSALLFVITKGMPLLFFYEFFFHFFNLRKESPHSIPPGGIPIDAKYNR